MSFASDLARLVTSGSTAIHGEAGVTSSGSTGKTTNLQQGSAKVWISVVAALSSINDSFNVSSLDDDGTGDGGVHITNDMGSAEYSIITGTDDGGSGSSIHVVDITQGTQAAGTYDFESVYVNSSTNRTNSDTETYHSIHGDLA